MSQIYTHVFKFNYKTLNVGGFSGVNNDKANFETISIEEILHCKSISRFPSELSKVGWESMFEHGS